MFQILRNHINTMLEETNLKYYNKNLDLVFTPRILEDLHANDDGVLSYARHD